MSIWLVSNRKHIRGPHQQSYMEHSFEQWLISHNYTNSLSGYLMEVRFFNPDTKKNGWADFVFPKLKLIIELDGSHHKKRKQLDDIRDDYLTGRGWKVVRVTHREYQSQQKLPEIKQLLHIP
jgi:very-short-patch-repair endonuclease